MIPIAVVAHTSRLPRAEALADAVKAELLTIDNGTAGPGYNHLVAWEWLAESWRDGSGNPWSVVLEDDALPVQGFQEQLKAVLDKSPCDVVSLYLGRGRPPQWQTSIQRVITEDVHFYRAPELLHHVGVAVRSKYVATMLTQLNRVDLSRVPIDEAIGKWVRQRRKTVAYCHPSIVDHDHRMTSTIMEHTSRHKTESGERNDPREIRKAWAFGSRRRWNSSVKDMPPPTM